MGNRSDGKMTGDEKKKRDPIFSACFVIFILAAVGVVGVYIDEQYLTEDNTRVAYGDTVNVDYTGTFYDYAGSDLAIEFDSGSIDFTANSSSDVLQKFWEACVGHKVGDEVRVTIGPEDGYIAGSTEHTSSLNGLTMAQTQTMTKAQFDSVYSNYDLESGGNGTLITTVYGWSALAYYSSTSQVVTLIHMPEAGQTYTYSYDDGNDETEESPVTVTFHVSSVGESITYDIAFEGQTVVDSTTGEVQMIELQFGNETWQVTHINGSEFTYKTCENTGNQTLYFVIKITSIS